LDLKGVPCPKDNSVCKYPMSRIQVNQKCDGKSECPVESMNKKKTATNDVRLKGFLELTDDGELCKFCKVKIDKSGSIYKCPSCGRTASMMLFMNYNPQALREKAVTV